MHLGGIWSSEWMKRRTIITVGRSRWVGTCNFTIFLSRGFHYRFIFRSNFPRIRLHGNGMTYHKKLTDATASLDRNCRSFTRCTKNRIVRKNAVTKDKYRSCTLLLIGSCCWSTVRQQQLSLSGLHSLPRSKLLKTIQMPQKYWTKRNLNFPSTNASYQIELDQTNKSCG